MKELKNTVVHLPTQEDHDEYIRMCKEAGWDTPTNDYWYKLNINTCMNVASTYCYCDILLATVTWSNILTLKQLKEIIGEKGSNPTSICVSTQGAFPQYLLDAIEKYNNEPKKRTPSDKKIYYFVNSKGEVITTIAQGDLSDKRRFKQNNFFSTEKAARMHSLRIQGMGVKNTAKRGGEFWYYSFYLKRVGKGHAWDAFWVEPKFKTEQEAENWGAKYSEAFEFFNK